MRHRDLAAVRERRFLRRAFLPFDDGDFVAGRAQKPGRGRADHAGAEDENLHAAYSAIGTQDQNRLRSPSTLSARRPRQDLLP